MEGDAAFAGLLLLPLSTAKHFELVESRGVRHFDSS